MNNFNPHELYIGVRGAGCGVREGVPLMRREYYGGCTQAGKLTINSNVQFQRRDGISVNG